MPHTHKIALILAGGGSLGAFESGVVTELLRQLEQRNAEGPHHFEIDIITGASAGGVVGALTARYLQDGPAPNEQPERNPLYRSWVRDIDVRHLLTDPPKNAAFSKKIIEQILQAGLLRGPEAVLPGNGGPFSCTPELLRLGMTLSNLQGMTYELPFLPIGRGKGRNFVTTVFKDVAHFLVRRDAPEDTDWHRVGNAAMACANLPIAFQPQTLARNVDDYPGAREVDNLELLQQGLAFIDGGLFDNKPLGEAIRLAREADGGPDDRRLFLLVDPKLDSSRHDPELNSESSLPDQLRRIASVIRDQSLAREWLRVCRRNQELDWRDGLSEQLAHLIAGSSAETDLQLLEGLGQLAGDIVEHKRQLFGLTRYPEDYLENSLKLQDRQVKLQTAAHIAGESADKRRIFHLCTFVLNNAAGLQNKADLRLGLVGADPDELAGEEFFGLLGFFDKKLRQHDFAVGEFMARRDVPKILDEHFPRALAAFGAPAEPGPPPVPPNEFTIANTDEEIRLQLCEQLMLVAKQSFEDLDLPEAAQLPLKLWARGRLRKLLELPDE